MSVKCITRMETEFTHYIIIKCDTLRKVYDAYGDGIIKARGTDFRVVSLSLYIYVYIIYWNIMSGGEYVLYE